MYATYARLSDYTVKGYPDKSLLPFMHNARESNTEILLAEKKTTLPSLKQIESL